MAKKRYGDYALQWAVGIIGIIGFATAACVVFDWHL